MERVTEKVQNWFKTKAKKEGWHGASFSGSQCVLTVELRVRK